MTDHAPEIVLTRDESRSTEQPAALYDANFSSYAPVTPNESGDKRKVNVDVSRLVRQYKSDASRVHRISLPLALSSRRSARNPVREDVVTAAEIRVVTRTGRGCNTAMLVGTSTAMRIQKHRVIFSRPQSGAHMSPGRVVMATMAVEEGCLFALSEARTAQNSTILIYRLDSIVNWPADELAAKHPKIASALCIGNLTLVAVYRVDKLRGTHRYIDPEFETAMTNPRRTASDVLLRLVDASVEVLRNNRTRAYHEYFAPANPSNTKHEFFGAEGCTLQTTPTTPEGFLPEVFAAITAYRCESADDNNRPVPTLPCGITYTLNEDKTEIDVVFSLPKHGNVVHAVAITIQSLPENWSEESTFRLKQRSFEDVVRIIDNNGGTLRQKMFVGD